MGATVNARMLEKTPAEGRVAPEWRWLKKRPSSQAWRRRGARTVATNLRELGADRLTVSKVLNHAESGVTKIYDRYAADPEKRQALERWANRLQAIVSGEPGKVVRLR